MLDPFLIYDIVIENKKLNALCNILNINYSYTFNVFHKHSIPGNNMKNKLSPVIPKLFWNKLERD